MCLLQWDEWHFSVLQDKRAKGKRTAFIWFAMQNFTHLGYPMKVLRGFGEARIKLLKGSFSGLYLLGRCRGDPVDCRRRPGSVNEMSLEVCLRFGLVLLLWCCPSASHDDSAPLGIVRRGLWECLCFTALRFEMETTQVNCCSTHSQGFGIVWVRS